MKFVQQIRSGTFAALFMGIALVVSAAVTSGCGSDDSGSAVGNANNWSNNGAAADTGGEPAHDTSTTADTSADTGHDTSAPRRYDPALAELGEPPDNCTTPIVNQEAAEGTRKARVFVPSYHVDFDTLASHQAFREHIHQMVHEKVLPCQADDAPTVVLFPESMGLPMLLIGDKAVEARQMEQSTQALTSMVSQVQQAFVYYAEKFPAASVTNRFLLALTDSVVRATYDTFGQIADRYDIFVSVTVNLPEFEKTTDPEVVERLSDPEYDAHDYVYEATGPQVHNRQILFGPDGEVVDETLKTYISRGEIDQLAIAAGDFSDIDVMQTPWGRTGVAISKPAWMPDVQDRLDDLGAQVIFQPTALVGGWAPPVSAEENHPRWESDLFLLGGWNLVQRSPRLTHNFVPQLTGNFFEMSIDGQVQIIEKASRQSGASAFIGQHGPLAGNTFIGPWVIEDPATTDPSLTLADRRAQLRDVGQSLLPGSGDLLENEYVEDMWAADLRASEPAEDAQVQTHPEVVTFGDSVFVISSAGAVGERRLRVERYHGGILQGTYEQEVAGYDLVRPTVAAGEDKLHVVAELIGDQENRLAYTAFRPSQMAFAQDATLLDAAQVGRWAFHPSIEISGRVLHMSWIKHTGDANRAFYAQTSLDAPFGNLSVNAEVAARPEARQALRANQWDARIAVDPQAIAVAWIDFKSWQWEVYVAVSTDGGLDWSAPVRIDTVPDGVSALNSTPTIEALGEQRFLVAWTDARATRPNTRIASRSFTAGSDGTLALDDVQLIDRQAGYARWMWRPNILVENGAASLVYEVLDDSRWALEMVSLGDGGVAGAPEVIVDATPIAKHFAKAANTAAGAVVAYEKVEPHAGAASSVVVEVVVP